jgi:transposase
MAKKYVVTLEAGERRQLKELVRVGRAAAYKRRHAEVLLKADAGPQGPAWADEQIAEAFDVSVRGIEYLRQRFVEQGLEAALGRQKRSRPPVERKLDGRKEARLIALSCSAPPEGRRRWTLRLLADRLVELAVVSSISYEAVRQVLKKTS